MRSSPVEDHYGSERLGERMLAALRTSGFDPGVSPFQEMQPIDELHIRGRSGTVQLVGLATLVEGMRVLDAGSGAGGPARFLAAVHGCRVLGVDLTHELCRSARVLSEALGLAERTTFVRGDAACLPVPDAAFDVVWTQHAQMNIEGKDGFYAELARALAPGGQLLFHDVFAGGGGDPFFPVPWAETPEVSFLVPPDAVEARLAGLGLRRVEWHDRTPGSALWAQEKLGRAQSEGSRLVMGSRAADKIDNLRRCLEERRVIVIQARYEKPPLR